jgi:crotonobetainyl-CoA:carnitine CoA-transferase CaiB-like acyl-CoA transferase
MTARHLAEHGAEVLRVRAPHRRDSDAVNFDTAWGKRTTIADLRSETGRDNVRALAAGADFIVQSYRPGALGRRGLSPEEAAKLRPGIIYVSASCYGSGGPWAERGGYDPVAQTASGVALEEALEGKPRPVRTITMNDYLTAFLGAAGAVTALMRRAREGGSYHVRVSLTRSSMWLYSFGTLPGAERYLAQPYADPAPPRLATQATPFGMITSLLPGVEYSATPAYWARPPEPAGASPLQWLPRCRVA